MEKIDPLCIVALFVGGLYGFRGKNKSKTYGVCWFSNNFKIRVWLVGGES